MDEQRVVLDTDFIGGITGYKAGDGADLFCRVFRTLGKVPVIHPYVAKNELTNDKIAQELIRNGDLTVIPYSIFLPDRGPERILYRRTFQDLYTIIQEEYVSRGGSIGPVPLKAEEDIFKRHAGRSFGEIHSILMAAELKIPLFYSNDGGARTVAGRYRVGQLIVQNAEEVSELLRTERTQVTGDERRFIRHFYTRNQH